MVRGEREMVMIGLLIIAGIMMIVGNLVTVRKLVMKEQGGWVMMRALVVMEKLVNWS